MMLSVHCMPCIFHSFIHSMTLHLQLDLQGAESCLMSVQCKYVKSASRRIQFLAQLSRATLDCRCSISCSRMNSGSCEVTVMSELLQVSFEPLDLPTILNAVMRCYFYKSSSPTTRIGVRRMVWNILLSLVCAICLIEATGNTQTNTISKVKPSSADRNDGSYLSDRNYRNPKNVLRQPQPPHFHDWTEMKTAMKNLARSLKGLQQTMTSRVSSTSLMMASLKEDIHSLNATFDQSRTFNLDEKKIECLAGNADRSNMNNSLSMYFTSRNETLDKEISKLYKTYDAARLCLSQDEALHWLQKLMLKAGNDIIMQRAKLGISNVPVAIFHGQAGVEEPKEIINGSDWSTDCKNLEVLDRNSSAVYVYNTSCVRLYTEKDCRGESFMFTGNEGAGFPFVGSLKYYDKKGRSVGPCIPSPLNHPE